MQLVALKKISFILPILSLLLWNCSGFDKRTKFDVTYVNRVSFDSTNTNMESGILISDTLIMDFTQDLSDHDARPGTLEFVRMVNFSLEIDRLKSPKAEDMDFLKSVEVYQIGDDVEDLLVVKTDSVLKDVGYFELAIRFDIDKDLKDFLLNDTSMYRVVYKTRYRIMQPVVLKLSAKYEVDTRKWGI